MNYRILHDDPQLSLIERLFRIRHIEDTISDFLSPTFQRYRTPRQLFDDATLAAQRVKKAITAGEKIMIFGDYDVDGITATFVMYTFFRDYLRYTNISLRLPHRVKDGYGIKKHHIDEIHTAGATLIITVDNGITAVTEASYAKELGIDLIITDHHKPLSRLPDTYATINPQCHPHHPEKQVCGSVVGAKFCLAIAHQYERSSDRKEQRVNDMLPYLAIATIADCMPLVGENRLIVKKGLEMMNTRRAYLHQPLQTLLDYLKIQQVDTFQIAFMISPRLNATGRVGHALDGLKALLSRDPEKQLEYLTHMDQMNTQRKKIQEKMIEDATAQLDLTKNLLRAASSEFHEGVIGIVAGRLTEKHSKPSLVLSINEQEGIATGSLRGPARCNIVSMLQSADAYLLRYGGHAQAGGVTVALEHLEKVIDIFQTRCAGLDVPEKDEQIVVDTPIYTHELADKVLNDLATFGPYGEGNREPVILLDDVQVTKSGTVGKNGGAHLKLQAKKHTTSFHILQRGKGETLNEIPLHTPLKIIGKIKDDAFNGGRYLDASYILSDEKTGM